MEASLLAFALLFGDMGVQTTSGSTSNAQKPPLAPGYLSGALAVVGSVQSESRAGESPDVVNTASQSFVTTAPQRFVAEIVTPRLAVELRRPDLNLAAWYGPRFYWQQPNQAEISGPLILHAFGLLLDARTSETVTVSGAATGSIGKPDYGMLPNVLGMVQGTLPPVVSIAAVSGNAQVAMRLTDRWALGLAAQIFYWHWLDIPPGLSSSTVTQQTAVSGQPTVALKLTPLDTLALGAAVGEATYSQSAGILTVTPVANWKRVLARRVNLNLTLGMTYAKTLGSGSVGMMPLLGASGSAESPIGSVELVSRLARRDEVLFQGRALAGVDFFIDPVLGVGLPRALASAELTVTSVPNWTTGLRGDFATPLQAPPPINGTAPDETAFSITVYLRRRATENLYAELGGRWADRGPALQTPDFAFHQRQLWAYLSLTATTRPIPRPTLSSQ